MKSELIYKRLLKQWVLSFNTIEINITKKNAAELIEKYNLIEDYSSLTLITYK